MLKFDVVVIGAGGAGMMCAIHTGRRGRSVALVDHATVIGRKILISGGGRCNFTNINAGPDNYVSNNPHFHKSALSRYSPGEFIEMVEKHKIAYHEKKLGQLFCDGSASQIVDMLVAECDKVGAEFLKGRIVKEVKKESDGSFLIYTNTESLSCESLVIATGGLSIPQIGATGFGYQIAQQFGLNVVETNPALDGFNFSAADLSKFKELTGVSVDSLVSVNKAAFRENILFTHTGLSGPASLQASLYWKKGDSIHINIAPDIDPVRYFNERFAEGSNKEVKNILAEIIPRRLAEILCQMENIKGNISELSEVKMRAITNRLENWQITPQGTVGYKKAEVTRGGVDTNALSSQTMEAKKVPGLYFIGEVVDVTGQLGGYNFQWAWASGYAAGQAV
ncbi:MAG: aminoacetone oxidase family FAD-binding enzyme [Candidatus Melainabacteria bacterium]|nr:MAG: aminoacetone oxidase family FAD-binding enzyme [Candidatus Melainabacteria bacterium]